MKTEEKILRLIDLTALDGSDTSARIEDLCKKAQEYHTAAVCVYPYYVPLAKKLLTATPVRVACVAGGFPASQTPLSIKTLEVEYCVKNGTDEVDIVIPIGGFLEGDKQRVIDEVKTLKKACGEKHLKVILETGALGTPEKIRTASLLAIEGGADFIKTSTGKIPVAATIEAARVMVEVIKEHYEKTGKYIGFKPAGGISTFEEALPYYELVESVLGEAWLTPDLFRFGASRLATDLAARIL
ncbi:MAG: deoxyribose-phosphate aldolase [Bacteroidales bacterium]|jgi:deoxyribose-phosphate aldolase|nr:deoxyribose-phosphate aldolase [Bacteroidales bacterium]